MTEFTPWTLFTDVGIISVLLLLGKLLRVKVKFIQQFFIPPSLLAGFMGLAFGPNGLGWLPMSDNIGTYAAILIALVFGSLPFSSSGLKGERKQIAKMWAYSQVGMLWQWTLGGFLGIAILSYLWNTDNFFGLAMPSGFIGGHGTAAAIGAAFSQLGYEDMMTLAMTAATVGIVSAVFIGLALVKWGTRKGHTSFLSDFNDLPKELRTGLIPEDKRESMGEAACSSISIDPLTFNFIVVSIVALGGYGLSKLVSYYIPNLQMPVFSCAFVVGILLKFFFDKTKITGYICPKTVGHLSGTFTDLLVAFGISAIKLEVVLQYLAPLLVLLLVGLLCTLLYVVIVGRMLMRQSYWFEKAVFTWGWFTGTMAMGIALLRTVDPKMKSRCLEDYALAYLFIAPVEICLITFAPIVFVNGYGVIFTTAAFLLGLGIMLFAWLKGWMKN